MKTLLAMLVGIAIGAGGLWLYQIAHDDTARDRVEEKVSAGAEKLKDALNESIDVGADVIKEEVGRTGQAVRRKVEGVVSRGSSEGASNSVGAASGAAREGSTP